MAPLPVTVEFLADGRCVVSASAESLALRGDVARRPQASDDVARSLQASDQVGGSFRCPLPYEALGRNAIELHVILPSGVGRVDESFPTLRWQQAGHEWVGTATLPSAPSFVSLGHAPPAAPRSHFGWNFYGFFVFAALFIAVYFAWARWMARPTGPAGAERTGLHG